MKRWSRCIALLAAGLAFAANAWAQDAAALRAKHASLREALAASAFQRPLVLDSTQNADDLKGEVYAVVEQPFGVVAGALQRSDQWCALLMLHLNVKGCSTSGKAPAEQLSLAVGRKFDQPLDDTFKVGFAYTLAAAGSDYLRVQMAADEGPVGTRNYRLALEAVPLDEQHSFLHMSYAYGYGTAARFAMQAYLATAGRDKVGFSVTGQSAGGQPVHVGGVRGVIERNTMRYYLAIEAYLASMALPPAEQQESRLRGWYAATERHARQLHEMEREEYLTMKRSELRRQQGAAPAAR